MIDYCSNPRRCQLQKVTFKPKETILTSLHLQDTHQNTNILHQNQDPYGKEYLYLNQPIVATTTTPRSLSIFQISETIFVNNNHFLSFLKSKTQNCKDRFKIQRIEKLGFISSLTIMDLNICLHKRKQAFTTRTLRRWKDINAIQSPRKK